MVAWWNKLTLGGFCLFKSTKQNLLLEHLHHTWMGVIAASDMFGTHSHYKTSVYNLYFISIVSYVSKILFLGYLCNLSWTYLIYWIRDIFSNKMSDTGSWLINVQVKCARPAHWLVTSSADFTWIDSNLNEGLQVLLLFCSILI